MSWHGHSVFRSIQFEWIARSSRVERRIAHTTVGASLSYHDIRQARSWFGYSYGDPDDSVRGYSSFFFVRHHWRDNARHVQPFVELGTGPMWSNRRVPAATSRFNMDSQLGVDLRLSRHPAAAYDRHGRGRGDQRVHRSAHSRFRTGAASDRHGEVLPDDVVRLLAEFLLPATSQDPLVDPAGDAAETRVLQPQERPFRHRGLANVQRLRHAGLADGQLHFAFGAHDSVLREAGVTDFTKYAVHPGAALLPDLFVG